MRDIVGGTAMPTIKGTSTLTHGQYGPQLHSLGPATSSTNTSGLSYGTCPAATDVFNTGSNIKNGTLTLIVRPNAFSSQGWVSKEDNNAVNGWHVGMFTNNAPLMLIEGVSVNTVWTGTPLPTAGLWYIISYVTKFGSGTSYTANSVEMYTNGVKNSMTLTAGGSSINTSSDSGRTLFIGSAKFNAAKDLDGDIAYVAFHRRDLSAAEIVALHSNPYQMLRSGQLYVPAYLAGGGGGSGVDVSVSGVSSTAELGSVSVTAAAGVTLSGLSSTTALGSTTQSGKAGVTLTGLSSTATLGTATAFVAGEAGNQNVGFLRTGSLSAGENFSPVVDTTATVSAGANTLFEGTYRIKQKEKVSPADADTIRLVWNKTSSGFYSIEIASNGYYQFFKWALPSFSTTLIADGFTTGNTGGTVGTWYPFKITHNGTTGAYSITVDGWTITGTDSTYATGGGTCGFNALNSYIQWDNVAGLTQCDFEKYAATSFTSNPGTITEWNWSYLPATTAGNSSGGIESVGATVSLSGVSSTTALGSVTVSAAANVTLSGLSSTCSLGTVTTNPKCVVTLSGLSSTTALGTTTQSGAANVTLSGLSSTCSLGTTTVSPQCVVTLSGLSSTTGLGSTTQAGKANVTLSGLSSTTALGTVSVSAGGSVTVTLTGLSSTTAVGTPTVTGTANVTLSGVSSTTAVGTPTVSPQCVVTLTGLSSTSGLGTVTPSPQCVVTLSGLSSTTALGTPTVTTPTASVEVAVDGLATTSAVGEVTAGPYFRAVNVLLDWDLRMQAKLGQVVAVRNQFGVQSGALNSFNSGGQATLGSGWKSTPLL